MVIIDAVYNTAVSDALRIGADWIDQSRPAIIRAAFKNFANGLINGDWRLILLVILKE